LVVPTVVVLDGDYRITRTVSEPDLEAKSDGFLSGPSYQATIPIAESQSDERFVLIYTNGAAVGDPVPVRNQMLGFRAQRSADGKIEAETKSSN